MRKRAPLLVVLAAAALLIFYWTFGKKTNPSGQTASGSGLSATSAPDKTGTGASGKKGLGGPASSAGKVANGKAVFTSKWGAGEGELGHERPQEGAPLGPMSVVTDGKGRLVVLDTVNGRVVRRGMDGKLDSEVKIGLLDPQDMAVAQDGSMAVLDRFADKKVAVYDESGALKGELPLIGEGIEDVGDVTGVFVDGTDVYAEREHGPLVRVGSTSGEPAEPQTEIPGRPSRDGLSYLLAGIIDGPAGRVYVASIEKATKSQRFTREFRQPYFVHAIVLLDTDKTGMIYFGTAVEQPDGSQSVLLSCLEPTKGNIVGTVTLPANTLPEETTRDFAVLDDGGVVYSLRAESGVSYLYYDCE